MGWNRYVRQKLANGVYLYRVLTNLNGKSLDKFIKPQEMNKQREVLINTSTKDTAKCT